MRVQAASASLALFFIVGFSLLHAADSGTESSAKKSAGLLGPPVIEVWYGNDQTFGVVGTPQRQAEILGNAFHSSGVRFLSYTLNGGSSRALNMGPNDRRLRNAGDFNIDLTYDELFYGDNTVIITAEAYNGEITQSTVNVRNLSSAVCPLPYTVSWTQLADSVQISDGKWGLMGGGVRILEPGYDRIITIGDTTWTDYEVTAKVTVHSLDSIQAAWGSSSGGPGIGFVMRWKGHTDAPVFSPPITQPISGYLPLGAIGWYHWGTGWGQTGPNRWEIDVPSNGDLAMRAQNTTIPLYFGIPYYFKMQVHTIPGTGPLYKFRVWQVGLPEPLGTWAMTWQEPDYALHEGSLCLLAHHVAATFGDVTVTQTPDGIPPVISNVVATPTSYSALVTWTTDEAATSVVDYGLTSSYDNQTSNTVNLVTSHSIQLQNLQPNTTYHYAVTSTDWGGASSTSLDRVFQTPVLTPPPAPVLLSPANGSSGNPTALTLRWNKSATATGYRLQLGTDATFATGIIVHDSTLTDTLRAITVLLQGTRYYWRVRARNASGEGSFSSVDTFSTLIGVPVLASPANGAVNIANTPRLTWYRVPFATSYRVRVALDSTYGGAAAIDDSSVVDTFRVATGLQVGQKYYWRVQARNSATVGTFSSAWVFTPGLASPTLLSPANGSTNQLLNPTLRWTSVPLATSYDLQIGTDPSFASGIAVSDSLLTDTSRVVAKALDQGTLYYWRVRARNVSGAGQYSGAWSFSTGLGSPQLVSPANRSSAQPLSIKFIWKKVNSATGYTFQLATDSTFATGIIKSDSSIVDTTRTVAGLSYKTTYYWHVRARQGGQSGPMSATWQCTTVLDPLGIVADDQGLPGTYALDQNYPNPFNPSTWIHFALPRQTHVRLEVYNVLGELVTTLVDEGMGAGFHRVEFSARDARGRPIAAGMYIYRLVTPEFTSAKKMILLK
jgi:hypothetical protein